MKKILLLTIFIWGIMTNANDRIGHRAWVIKESLSLEKHLEKSKTDVSKVMWQYNQNIVPLNYLFEIKRKIDFKTQALEFCFGQYARVCTLSEIDTFKEDKEKLIEDEFYVKLAFPILAHELIDEWLEDFVIEGRELGQVGLKELRKRRNTEFYGVLTDAIESITEELSEKIERTTDLRELYIKVLTDKKERSFYSDLSSFTEELVQIYSHAVIKEGQPEKFLMIHIDEIKIATNERERRDLIKDVLIFAIPMTFGPVTWVFRGIAATKITHLIAKFKGKFFKKNPVDEYDDVIVYEPDPSLVIDHNVLIQNSQNVINAVTSRDKFMRQFNGASSGSQVQSMRSIQTEVNSRSQVLYGR